MYRYIIYKIYSNAGEYHRRIWNKSSFSCSNKKDRQLSARARCNGV